MFSSLFLASALASLANAQTQDAPIITNEPSMATYQAIMQSSKEPQGTVTGVSNTNGTGISFNINLFDFPANEGPFLYHIHEFRVPNDGNCTATGAHLDPYNRTESPPCNASEPQTCQLGDLSGKHGDIPQTSSSFQTLVGDNYLSTTPGNVAFFGNRSLVIHNKSGVRIQCGNFVGQGNAATTSSTASMSATGGAASSATSSGAKTSATTNAGTVATANGAAIVGVAAAAWAFM